MPALSMEEVALAKDRLRKESIVDEINQKLINSQSGYIEIVVGNCNERVSRMVREEFQTKGWEINRQATSSNSYRFTFRM